MQAMQGISADELFVLLAAPERRAILNHLHTTQDVPAADLIQHIVSQWQIHEVRPDPHEIEVGLMHCHLPKLVESGMVEYDRSTGRVCRTSAADEADPYLALIRD